MEDGEIKCNVMLFASAAEAIGCRDKVMMMPIGSTAGDLFDTLAGDNEQFLALKEWCAIAIDKQLCPADTPLEDGCTIAFLPPVSGG
ncbi:MAG: MoaD/ThiS family protein [Phycisphaerales bacterium]|nr:MoaD/ThiS family protein [Planctomycetota bacterium]MBL6997171.1 MoaD/ThiS family protein [Phycisphaerales bacterium]